MFGKGSLPVIEAKLKFLESRHQVISHNIANVHTRYYKTQDLPFAEFDKMLADSLAARDEKHVKVYKEEPSWDVYTDWTERSEYRMDEPRLSIMRHGDNNVDIDREIAKLGRNTAMFQTMSGLAKKHYDLLRSTIRETP